DMFGTDEKIGKGEELASDFQRFRDAWRATEPTPALYPVMTKAVPEKIREAENVGMVMDEHYGLGLMKDYGPFLEICETGVLTDEGKTTLATYVAHIEQIPPAWQRVLERFPDGTVKAVEQLVGPEEKTDVMNLIQAILKAPRVFPPVVAILDPDLQAALPQP
ncbi:MAG: hypothetical protein ACYTHN_15370, partial [Planctomycetota bacterium]